MNGRNRQPVPHLAGLGGGSPNLYAASPTFQDVSVAGNLIVSGTSTMQSLACTSVTATQNVIADVVECEGLLARQFVETDQGTFDSVETLNLTSIDVVFKKLTQGEPIGTQINELHDTYVDGVLSTDHLSADVAVVQTYSGVESSVNRLTIFDSLTLGLETRNISGTFTMNMSSTSTIIRLVNSAQSNRTVILTGTPAVGTIYIFTKAGGNRNWSLLNSATSQMNFFSFRTLPWDTTIMSTTETTMFCYYYVDSYGSKMLYRIFAL